MLTNENTWLNKMEVYLKKLTKVHEDLVRLDGYFKKKKLEYFKLNYFQNFYEKFFKLSMLLMTLLIILFCYYFYIFWNFMPNIENSNKGLSLDFWNGTNWNDFSYRREIICIIIFHFLFVMFLWCIILTILKDPGSLHEEYKDVFSSINIIWSLYNYFENYQGDSHSYFKLNNSNKNEIKSIIQEILDNYNDIINKFYECLHAYNLLKIPWNQRFLEEGYDSEIGEYNNSIYSRRKNSAEKELVDLSKALKNLNNQINIFFEKNDLHKLYLENTTFYDVSIDNNRFCKFCLLKKPDRTHHCRTCKKCLKKMDHHCIVLGTCIASSNYKSFYLTLIYSTLLLNFSFYTSIKTIFFYTEEFNNTFDSIYYILYVFVIGILGVFITYFTCFHTRLIFINKTTIEYKEKSIDTNSYMKYDLGVIRNFQEVLGKNVFLWFIPIGKEEILDGYSFEINEEFIYTTGKDESRIIYTSQNTNNTNNTCNKKDYKSERSNDEIPKLSP